MIEIINDLAKDFGNSFIETKDLIISSGFKLENNENENNYIFKKIIRINSDVFYLTKPSLPAPSIATKAHWNIFTSLMVENFFFPIFKFFFYL